MLCGGGDSANYSSAFLAHSLLASAYCNGWGRTEEALDLPEDSISGNSSYELCSQCFFSLESGVSSVDELV